MEATKIKPASLLVCCFLLLVLTANLVMAEFDFGDGPSQEEKQLFDQILEPVMVIYNLIKYIATAVAGVMALFAGITYITSGSDPKKRENSKSMAMYIVIGLIIIWAAPFVVNLIVG